MPDSLRDYMSDMNKRVDEILDEDETYPAAVAAQQLHDWLDEHDPELLTGWLKQYAVAILRDLILQRNRQRRNTDARDRTKVHFSSAARDYEAGDPDALGFFRQRFVVNPKGDLKRVRDMIYDDWKFVATDYDRAAQNSKRKAAFARAVMKKLTSGKTTGEVYTEEQLAALYREFTEKGSKAAA